MKVNDNSITPACPYSHVEGLYATAIGYEIHYNQYWWYNRVDSFRTVLKLPRCLQLLVGLPYEK